MVRVLVFTPTLAQDIFNSLTEANQQSIDSLVSTLSLQDQVKQLVWIPDSMLSDKEPRIGGIIRQELNSLHLSGNLSYPMKIVNIYRRLPSISNDELPFPGYDVRIAANAHIPILINYLLNTDAVIDFRPDARNHSVFAFEMNDSIPIAYPVYTDENMKEILLNHHRFALWNLPYDSLVKTIETLRFKKKEKIRLRTRVKDELASRQLRNNIKRNQEINNYQKSKFEQWKWDTHARSFVVNQKRAIIPIRSLVDVSLATLTTDSSMFLAMKQSLDKYMTCEHYHVSDTDPETQLTRLSSYDYVVIPIESRSSLDKKWAKKLSSKTRVILVDFSGNPEYDNIQDVALIKSFGNTLLQQEQVAQLIFGAIGNNDSTMPGLSNPLQRLRYTNPLVAGMDPEVLHTIDTLVEHAIQTTAMPGCQLLVAINGTVAYEKNYGFLTYDSLEQVGNGTIYDLASLTKVLATTQAVMLLEENQLISIDKSISTYLPELVNTNKSDILIRELLAHQGGLASFYPYWKPLKSLQKNSEAYFRHDSAKKFVQVGKQLFVSPIAGDSVLRWAASSELIKKEVSHHAFEYSYSDLAYYLIKEVVERIIHQSIDAFLTQNLYAPIGTDLLFNPLCKTPMSRIAPTEKVSGLRHELLRGFVHDSNAALFGGVGGHAGLFGGVNDVAKMLQLQLQEGRYGGTRYFYPETINKFTKRQYINNHRGLGWDKPGNGPGGPVSDLASPKAFGHTGFTGISAWADPTNNLIFVFLSNRIYPSSENLKLIEQNIRTRIQDLVYGAVITEK